MSAQLDILETLEDLTQAPVKKGAERHRRKRVMLSVRVRVRGAVGTLDMFEEIVESLDVSRDGVLLSTSRGGYAVGEQLQKRVRIGIRRRRSTCRAKPE